MIENLTVRNIALIEEIDVRFSAGFNILTGETGAGKSILVGALGLLLGNKAGADTIRTGKEEGMVSAYFTVSGHPEALEWLSLRGIEPEEGSVLLRRTIRRTGRGSVYIQSSPVTLADLSEFTSMLVDMHSQHAHQSLMRADNHRRLLDHFAGLDEQVKSLSESFYHLSDLKKEQDELLKSESEREREIDYLRFALQEIQDAQLKPGEDDQLESELKVISQSEKLFTALEQINELVSESRGGALSSLREASSALETVCDIDESQASLLDRYLSAFYEIEDVAEGLNSHRNSLDFSPETLDRVQSRIQQIRRLTKKYGGSVESVLNYAAEAESRIDLLDNSAHSLDKLQKEMKLLEDEIRVQAVQISNSRKEYAARLEEQVTENLVKLGMEKAVLSISIEVRAMEDGKPACGPFGIDVIRFLFSANPGEPLKELRAIASGGELSRVMLSIKSVFADKDPIQTLVFDEIDTGIGGAVARSVATHISSLGKFKQILCISHLASIAARADAHYKILKESPEEQTVTRLIPLEGEERVREIGRMLSGDSVTEVSLEHARQLMRENY